MVYRLPHSHLGGINTPRTYKPHSHLSGKSALVFHTYSHLDGIDTRGVYYAYSHPGGKQRRISHTGGYHGGKTAAVDIPRENFYWKRLPARLHFAAFTTEKKRLSAQLAI